uniref:Uncharacterized protein n=1 Tax=Anguilla anguilla TaxID=7936 RepID=A0A0E9VNT9_ANGAN
MYCTAASV